jgi:hypothetical protein
MLKEELQCYRTLWDGYVTGANPSKPSLKKNNGPGEMLNNQLTLMGVSPPPLWLPRMR